MSEQAKPKARRHPTDFNQLATSIVSMATNEAIERPTASSGKNPAAVALGRLGGMKGGKARASSMTPERRSEIAKKAAQTRWTDAAKNK